MTASHTDAELFGMLCRYTETEQHDAKPRAMVRAYALFRTSLLPFEPVSRVLTQQRVSDPVLDACCSVDCQRSAVLFKIL